MSRLLVKRILILLGVLLLINLLSYVIAMYLFTWVFPQHPTYFLNNAPEIPDTNAPLLHVLQGYPAYLWGALQGDLGARVTNGMPVMRSIGVALPRSLILLVLGMVTAAVLGVLGGLFSINRKKRRTNPLALVLSVAGYSLPGFFLGVLIAFQLAINIRLKGYAGDPLLPVTGYGLDEHLILPVLALALRPAGEIARLTSELLADELGKPYIRTARAKGLVWRLVILRHAFRTVMANVIVTLGNSLRYLISTLLIVEWLFSWPGLGRELVRLVLLQYGVVLNFDPWFITGIITTLTLIALVVSFMTHTASWMVDPRLKKALISEGGAS